MSSSLFLWNRCELYWQITLKFGVKQVDKFAPWIDNEADILSVRPSSERVSSRWKFVPYNLFDTNFRVLLQDSAPCTASLEIKLSYWKIIQQRTNGCVAFIACLRLWIEPNSWSCGMELTGAEANFYPPWNIINITSFSETSINLCWNKNSTSDYLDASTVALFAFFLEAITADSISKQLGNPKIQYNRSILQHSNNNRNMLRRLPHDE